MNSAIRKAAILLVLTGMLLSACGTDLWGTYDLYLTPTPIPSNTIPPLPESTPTNLFILPTITQTATVTVTPSLTPTATEAVSPGTPRPDIIYSSQSGDNVAAVAAHFGVKISEITSVGSLPTTGFLNPDTPLIIPNVQSTVPTTPSQQIMPDSELVYSPSAQSFNTESYVNSAGGKLSTYHGYMVTVGTLTGAEGIQQMAYWSSINPHMLLALIQYYTGWVQGQPKAGVDETYPLGYRNPQSAGLFMQLRLPVKELLAGYYGWRDGKLTELTFPDGSTLRIAPTLNAGTVALQYMFSKQLNYTDWMQAINPDTGFPAFYAEMFGDPWERANETGPLFPPDLTQPPFILPFELGVPWTFTGGPHPAWELESAWAALDFAPPMDTSGCGESTAWVVAVDSGQIVRSETGYVVLDLDGDGFEQTGWVVLFLHIATKDRVPAGTWVNTGDHIGHPSCEGGDAQGTHVHIARKYNGEWVSAGDPLPFVMSGWTTHSGSAPYIGTLTKGNEMVTSSTVSEQGSQIIRLPGE